MHKPAIYNSAVCQLQELKGGGGVGWDESMANLSYYDIPAGNEYIIEIRDRFFIKTKKFWCGKRSLKFIQRKVLPHRTFFIFKDSFPAVPHLLYDYVYFLLFFPVLEPIPRKFLSLTKFCFYPQQEYIPVRSRHIAYIAAERTKLYFGPIAKIVGIQEDWACTKWAIIPNFLLGKKEIDIAFSFTGFAS